MKKFLISFYDAFTRQFSLVIHDLGVLIFLFLLPLAYPIVYSLIYNPEVVRDVAVVVVDNDRSANSRELTRRLDAAQGFYVKGYAANLNEAKHAMNSHEAYGILEIPDGFDRRLENDEQGIAVLYCEMSLMLRYKALLVSATDVMQEFGGVITAERIDRIAPLAETISDGNIMPVENIAMGNIKSGFDSFVMPGILILILQQSLMLAIGMCGGAIRENPRKANYNPVTGRPGPAMAMFAQAAVYFIIMLAPMMFLTHYVPLIFRFPMAGNDFQILLFLVPLVLATIGMGFVLQGIVRERESVFVIWVATSVVFLFLSGLTWPRYAMNGFWLALSDCVPGTWGVEGFIRMNTNGASLAQVRECYINLWILAAVYMALGYIVHRFVERPAVKRAMKESLPAKSATSN